MEWIKVEDQIPKNGELVIMSDGKSIWVEQYQAPEECSLEYEWTHWHPYELPKSK